MHIYTCIHTQSHVHIHTLERYAPKPFIDSLETNELDKMNPTQICDSFKGRHLRAHMQIHWPPYAVIQLRAIWG